MSFAKTKDGVEIFYKDWGPKTAQPIMFHHGWPLSADDWDTQMLFFLEHGFRVVAHDRRGHGRSSQVSDGHDMDHYAADAFAVVEHLDLKNAVHIGHSTGGGEVARFVARHGQPAGSRQVRPHVRDPSVDAEDRRQSGRLAARGFRWPPQRDRRQSRAILPRFRNGALLWLQSGRRQGSEGVIRNWWRQSMMGSAKAHYEGIKAFSETDQTEDLKAITVPTLVLHGDDDQVVPYADAALKSIKLLKNGTLKIYKGFPHGMPTIHADTINADLLAFVKG